MGRHDHAGRAVATLECLFVKKGLLEGMEAAVGVEAFNGCDLLIGHRVSLGEAGAHGASVNQDSAGPALAFATAVFGPREADLVTQDPEKALAGSGINLMFVAVDDQGDGWHILSS